MRRLLQALPFAAAILLFAGCQTAFDDNSVGNETYLVSDGYKKLEINNKAGNVVVVTADTDSISIDYTQKASGVSNDIFPHDYSKDINVTFDADKDKGTIKITTDFPEASLINYSVDFAVWVPENIELDIVNTSGDVGVTGIACKPTIRVTSGDVVAKDLKCGVDAATVSGDVECEIATLPPSQTVTLNAINATTGDITLKVAAMDTTNALVLTGSSGNIGITLPANVELSFDMSTTSGSVVINGFTPTQGTPWTETHKVGTIGTGNTKSTLSAVMESGDVTLDSGD